MQAGSLVILRWRADQALETMKTLLAGCEDRGEVANLVLNSW